MYILLSGVFNYKGYFMVQEGLTAADIGQVIFLVLVVGVGVGGFIYAAVKQDK